MLVIVACNWVVPETIECDTWMSMSASCSCVAMGIVVGICMDIYLNSTYSHSTAFCFPVVLSQLASLEKSIQLSICATRYLSRVENT